MIHITDIRERTISLRSDIRNSWISFNEMDTSLVAVISNLIRDGRPVVGYGFASNGRYAQGGILRARLIPRLLSTSPEELSDESGDNLEPERVWSAAMRNEKPGGHGERSVAMGALDMAVWDLVAKIQERPLFRVLADRYAKGPPDERVFVYAAGGYYAPGKSNDALADEMRHYLDLGYTHVKMKIGGAGLREDMDRLEAVVRAVGSAKKVAVDANARLDEPAAVAYADALEPFGLFWFEEAGDPLDFELQRKVAERYPGRMATGENLFSVMDVRNLLRYGGMRPDLDVVQVDPSLGYGVVEYMRILHAMEELGWSSRSCIPHGGHQMTLHLAAALHLGGNESYPGAFEPIGGFADGQSVVDGYVRLDEEPGIGIERKGRLWTLCRDLSS